MIPRPENWCRDTFPPPTVVCCQVQVQGVLPQARSLGHLGLNLAGRGVLPPPLKGNWIGLCQTPGPYKQNFVDNPATVYIKCQEKINVTKVAENPLFRETAQLRSYPRPNAGPSARVLLPAWFGFYCGFGH